MSDEVAAPSASPPLPLAEQIQALRRLALVATRPAGAEIHRDLIEEVARALGVALAMVAVFADNRRTTMRTLAAVVHGEQLPPIEYLLAQSPCVEVVGKGFRYMPCGILTRYGSDGVVARLGLDAYAAFPMNDSRGEPLGLVAVLDPQVIAGGDPDHAEAVLKIAAVRLAAELERSAGSEALRRSAASYRAIFEAAEDSILVHDWESFRLVDVNDKAVQSFGYTREELLAIDPAELMSGEAPYDMAHAVAHLELAKLGRCPPFEWKTRLKDGRLQWQEVRLKPVTIDGQTQILAFARDITERKAAEEQLRASEEQHRSIFNASLDAALVKDAEHRIVDVNEAYVRMVGYERQELLGQRLSQFVPAELQARCDVLVPEILAGQPCQLEAKMLRRDGSTFEVEIRGTPVQYRGRRLALVIMRDITERKAAEALLRASEAQYRAIFDASADALILWNSQFRRVDVNPAYERMYGWSRDEVIGHGYEHLPYPEEYARPRRELVRRALAGEPCRAELQAVRKDGTPFATEVHAIPFTHRGEPHVLAIARDLTERKKAEADLRAREELHRALFDSSVDAMVLYDRTLHLVDINPAFARIRGFPREDLVGRHWSQRADAQDFQDVLALIESALAGHEASTIKNVPHADGRRIDMELRYLPVQLDGEPFALGIGRDITERKAAEARLRASEEQYRAIFNASADALMLWDSRLKRVDINAAHERIFGYARDELIGRAFENLNYPEELVQPRLEMVRRALGGEPSHVEVEALRKDGRRILTELRTIPFQHRGEPHVLQIARDITDRRAAEAERSTLETQLRQAQKMEAIGQLTGGIAHDFNNILTSVIGYIVLAQERAERQGDDTLVRQLGSAQTAAQRARELIAQMLAFARRQRGDRHLIALGPVVRQAMQLLRSTMPTSIELDDTGLCGNAELPPVQADAVQIEQVLLNLCINARDAMQRSGRIAVRLRESTRAPMRCTSCGATVAPGRWLELEVADNGSGIAPEVLPRMFEPFFTTKEVGRGSGMGLAMVHGIVHEHDGHIVVDTVPGRGTSFHVLLPAADGTVDAQAATAPASDAGAALAGRVMVVDDEPMVAAFMRELLEGWGLEVVAPQDALAAARWLDDPAHDVDLLITDLTMPQMNGLDLAHHVGVLRPRLPVLLYSGDTDAVDADALLRAGVRAMLGKPVDPSTLKSALSRLLSGTA